MQIVAEFVASAASARDFPRDRLPEVALVGRSNVGKSSLINALVRRKLARTSAAPGKTRLANFYRVQRGSEPALYLVDLPGYGYARGGDVSAREFNRLADVYLYARRARRMMFRLAGGAPGGSLTGRTRGDRGAAAGGFAPPRPRFGPRGRTWVKSQECPCGIVATKVDKLTRAERARHTRQLESLFDVPVTLVSAETGEGLDELWKLIARLRNRRTAP